MSRAGMLGVAVVALLETACLVQITHVSDPSPLFREARAEAARLAGRPGPARELNVLVWDRDDGELVRVSLPMWIVRKAERRIDWRNEVESDDGVQDHVRHALRRVRLEDIEKAGLGVLAEVEEDGGDQVLVWLR
jgi:nucleoside-diphosphate-sugar epimerase